jgi:alpha,alpha-trehalose phosphorylase
MANAGGSYLMMMYGLLGLSFSNVLSISPVKQTEIKFYEVHFEYQGSRLSVTYENHALCLKTDKPIQVRIYEEEVTVKNQLILSVK